MRSLGWLIIGFVATGCPVDPLAPIDASMIDGTVCTPITWYVDCDGDGHAGVGAQTMSSCAAPTPAACGGGWVSVMPVVGSSDCNDTRADSYPGASEVCDGADNDCDGTDDDGVLITYYQDEDGDGVGGGKFPTMGCSVPPGYSTSFNDCNDNCVTCYPGGTETCDQKDNDCDTAIDEGVRLTFYEDNDNDGYGNPGSPTQACTAPLGYVTNSTDCDDTSTGGNINPGETELCFNGIDDNCSGGEDEHTYCQIGCDWTGARWLSHGWEAANAFNVGAWFSCSSSRLTNVQYVYNNPPGLGTTAVSGGTGDVLVGCTWGAGDRWASQGYDGAAAFTEGAEFHCTGTRIDQIKWAGNTYPSLPAASGQLSCNWTGAIWLSNGLSSGCAFETGFRITCNNNRLTHFEWIQDAGCPPGR